MIEKLCGEANVDAKDVIIAYLTKQVQELEKQLLDASIQIQELTEQDMWCPSNCEKLEKLRCENQKLKEEVKAVNKGLRKVQQRSIKYKNRCLKLNEKMKELKQPQMFIDTQDIEERYAEGLYQDFLKEENKQLKKQLEETNKMIEKCGFVNIEQVMLSYCGLIVQQNEFIKYLEDKIYNIEPKGTGINYNCEYDSEEDYINAMEEQSKLITLKSILQKYKEIIGGK